MFYIYQCNVSKAIKVTFTLLGFYHGKVVHTNSLLLRLCFTGELETHTHTHTHTLNNVTIY